MSGSSPGLTPRSSTSTTSAASATSHGTFGSPPSHQTSQDRGSFEQRLSNESASQKDGKSRSRYSQDEDTGDSNRRRRGPRTSGGFLLDTAPIVSNKIRTRKNEITDKGKSKEEGPGGFLSARKTKTIEHRPKPSIGSSPLATAVTNASTDRRGDINSSQGDEKSLNDSMTTNGDASSNVSHLDGVNESPRNRDYPRLSSLDTDPTQIINLALSLSESRRRQFSFGRVSPVDPISSRRITSSGTSRYTSSPLIGSGGGSLRQHVQQNRQFSRNASPRSEHFPRDANTSPSTRSWHEPDDSLGKPTTPTLNFDLVDDLSFNPSDATLLRAERAQQTLELFYEYRRVLQYLPKLPNPKSRPNTSKDLGKRIVEIPEILGRSYNPLQYIRNRKVRTFKRQNLNSELGGWKNLANVRSWVDAVADERKEKISRVDEKYPLPPFSSQEGEQIVSSSTPPSSVRNSQGSTTIKSSRPRVDWITSPWDMLADAYWLSQDDHKYFIEDRDGDKIYPIKRGSADPISRISQDLNRPVARRSQSIPRQNDNSPKTNTSAVELEDEESKERGRKRHQFRSSVTSLQDHGSSQDRKSRWPRNLIRSRSSSSSGESTQGSLTRHQRYRNTQESRERQQSAVLEKQVMELLAKEAENLDWQTAEDVQKNGFQEKIASEDVSGAKTRIDAKYPSVIDAELIQSPPPYDLRKLHAKASLERLKLQGHNRHSTLEDFHSTAPSSPVSNAHVPSIAINLSPPASRSNSIAPIPAEHNRTRKVNQRDKCPTGETDYERENVSSTDWNHNDNNDVAPHTTTNSSPSDGFLSPKTAENFGRILRHRHTDSRSARTSKDLKDSESRFKGLLKGGRIAELVGNEVSKVGDIFWRKDTSKHHSALASPASSNASDASDTDDDVLINKLKRSTSNLRHGADVDGEENGRPRKTTTQDLPKYYLNNLPSFRSPLRRDDDVVATPKGEDHMLRQQTASRERGRLSRLNDLAPPNLDMRGLSSSRSPPISRVQTRETDASTYDSRRNSANPSESGLDETDIKSSYRKGLPARLGAGGPTSIPMTGLASLGVRSNPSRHRSSVGSKSQWSLSDRAVSPAKGVTTNRDIIRTRALLLSSGVKAQEIARRAYEVPKNQPPIIADLEQRMKTSLPRVPHSQLHVLAARCFVKNISETNNRIHSAMDTFSTETIPTLHDRVKALDQFITSDLTPMVHAAADDADALSMELASSYRLSIRRLNDSIDFIVRRKRRRFRWVRRSGWTMLEWLLLGAMWCVWLVVVIVRLVRGSVRGVYKAIRWVLWLE